MIGNEVKLLGVDCHFNVYHLNKGDEIPIHQHDVDHIGLVVQGKVRVYTHHHFAEVGPDHIITLHAPNPHGYVALEDHTILINVFNTRGKENGSS